MLIVALFALALQLPQSAAYGSERCSADDGPEVGIGILCDRARIAIESREISVAEDLSQAAAALAPSYPGVWVVRAEVAQMGRRLDEARAHYEKAASLDPGNAAILVATGDFEAAEGNVRGAAVLYERAAEIDPAFPGLAQRLEALGDEAKPNEI